MPKARTRPHCQFSPAKSRAVRPIPKSSKGHFVCQIVFDRQGRPQCLGVGSLLEHDSALCLIYSPGFYDLEEQLAALPFTKPGGKPSVHFFDFRLTQTSGRRICISVKREKVALTAEYQANFEAIRTAAVGNICDAAITVTERNIHPITLHNAKLFHAARKPEPEIDAFVEECVKSVSAPVRISDFLKQSGLGGKGFFSVARAIRSGHAKQFTPEKITGNSLITYGRAA